MVTIRRPDHLPRFGDPAPDQPARASRVGETPVPGNVSYLHSMSEGECFQLHGIPWVVPPVPALVGADLFKLKAHIANAHKAGTDDVDDHVATVRELIGLETKCLRPVRKRDKLLRKFGLWRPLKNASDADLALLLDFLLALRSKSTIRRYPVAHRN
jgi:hypothetical protein